MTSAEPHFELRLRLPCLATRTPAPATTNAVAVEILKVPRASPPVPQVSTSASRPVPLTSSAESGEEATAPPRRAWPRRSPQSLPPSRPSCAEPPARRQSARRWRFPEKTSVITARASSRVSDSSLVGDALQGVGDHGVGYKTSIVFHAQLRVQPDPREESTLEIMPNGRSVPLCALCDPAAII